MYKFKIINFKPYEYEIFEEELNQLGQKGYKTDDLSLLTIFKKTDKKYYYKIDFHIPEGKSRFDKQTSKQKFFDPYLDDNYEAIYNKNNMYVFIGEKPSQRQINYQAKKHFITEKKSFQYLNYFIASIIISIAFIGMTFIASTIDTFITYGLTFLFIGIILVCLTMIYRSFCNMYFTRQLKQKLHQKTNNLSSHLLKKLHKIYGIAFTIAIIVIVGGLIEDTFNAKPFSLNDHPVLSMKDLGINQETEFSSLSKASFTVPHSYTSLETNQDKSSLYIKEYNLNSEKSAKQLLQDFSKHPQQYYCTDTQLTNNIIYGYTDKELTTLIIQKNNKVTLVSPSWKLTDKQIQSIIEYYN